MFVPVYVWVAIALYLSVSAWIRVIRFPIIRKIDEQELQKAQSQLQEATLALAQTKDQCALAKTARQRQLAEWAQADAAKPLSAHTVN